MTAWSPAGIPGPKPEDERFMGLALALGERHLGLTWPNPSVGAVVVADRGGAPVIVAEGITQPGGRLHAERIALDRAGVVFRFGKRAEYKTAPNTFLENEYTAEHAEASRRLVESLGEQIVSGVAEARGLSADKVRELIDRAPLTASEALEEGLVDELAYRDQVYAHVRRRAGEGARVSGGDLVGPVLHAVTVIKA